MHDRSRRVVDKEARFIEALVLTGDVVASARTAGYAQPRETASRLMRRPDVIAAIRTAALTRLHTEGAAVATNTLIEIASDKTAPKNARVAASRTLCEMTHLGGLDALGIDKPLSEMTRAELSAAKDRAMAYLAELDRPMIEGRAVEVHDEGDDEAFDDAPVDLFG